MRQKGAVHGESTYSRERQTHLHPELRASKPIPFVAHQVRDPLPEFVYARDAPASLETVISLPWTSFARTTSSILALKQRPSHLGLGLRLNK